MLELETLLAVLSALDSAFATSALDPALVVSAVEVSLLAVSLDAALVVLGAALLCASLLEFEELPAALFALDVALAASALDAALLAVSLDAALLAVSLDAALFALELEEATSPSVFSLMDVDGVSSFTATGPEAVSSQLAQKNPVRAMAIFFQCL